MWYFYSYGEKISPFQKMNNYIVPVRKHIQQETKLLNYCLMIIRAIYICMHTCSNIYKNKHDLSEMYYIRH